MAFNFFEEEDNLEDLFDTPKPQVSKAAPNELDDLESLFEATPANLPEPEPQVTSPMPTDTVSDLNVAPRTAHEPIEQLDNLENLFDEDNIVAPPTLEVVKYNWQRAKLQADRGLIGAEMMVDYSKDRDQGFWDVNAIEQELESIYKPEMELKFTANPFKYATGSAASFLHSIAKGSLTSAKYATLAGGATALA